MSFDPMPQTASADDRASLVTMNRLGRTSTVLNEVNERFISLASHATKPVLDLGCAMGVATIPALHAGAWVHANDIDERHLNVVWKRASPIERERLTLVQGRFPEDLSYNEECLSTIHACNLLNFLTGDEIDLGFEKIARWLEPGGFFLSMSGSPYAKNIKGFIPIYEDRILQGARWPGECSDISAVSDCETVSELPRFLHLLDPTVLARSAKRAGLDVLEAAFLHRRGTPDYIRLDGRENVVLIAAKPG